MIFSAGKSLFNTYGILQRGEKVFTQIVPDCKAKTLQAIIKGRIDVKSAIHSDGWSGYNGLVDVEYSTHFRVTHSKNEFARGKAQINVIESFWSFAKRRV